MTTRIEDSDLVIHILNVGFGDSIVVELPAAAGVGRRIGIVDCRSSTKTQEYLTKLNELRPFEGVAFVCATHPHLDHIQGIRRLLSEDAAHLRPARFWDSGFRHKSLTYRRILETVRDRRIPMLRVSSGMEWYFGTTRITALSPSVSLRNRYGTYGVDINNASIVLRLENCKRDAVTLQSERYTGSEDPDNRRGAGRSVAILGADAEYDSWARITEEYPSIVRVSQNDPLVKKMVNLLACAVVKVSHHGSMHSAPFEVYERMSPAVAILSNKQTESTRTLRGKRVTRKLYPHPVTAEALRESGAEVLTTDGSFENAGNPRPGSVVVVIPPGGRASRPIKLDDGTGDVPDPPESF